MKLKDTKSLFSAHSTLNPTTRNDKKSEHERAQNFAKILGEVGHVWQNQSGHSEIRKGQGRQEPGGLIPDLCFLGEPGLQHAEVQEGAEGLKTPSILWC